MHLDVDDGTDAADAPQQVEALEGVVVVFGCCEPGGAVFLRRYDPDGAVVWTTPIAGLATPFNSTMGLDVDADGGIHAAWITAAKALWLGEFTADGDEVWTAVVDDPELAGVYPRGLGVTPQGKRVVVGSRALMNSEDAFYGVFDAGTLSWSETVSGTYTAGNDAFEDVAIDSRGLALIAGRRHQTGGVQGTHEAFVRLFAPSPGTCPRGHPSRPEARPAPHCWKQ
ncbi:MAG TPA: hypothetical protein PKW35_01970 [Nannocystaceae bacterium]|nr:hypothetical protein [Nannocystaceae bacterium]